MKTRVIFYLIGGVLILGAGISSAVTDGATVPDVITIACGVLILALAGWQYSRSHGSDSADGPPKL
ncbi:MULTISPECIES: hypothetical protein [unclassified Rathayibacter]|uniref:hypothetical protein n=1 Tax=unclassified Rathayibacter TaxID=2609250 RepID=UPI000700088D|nr:MULTISPECIES: hypothetical protein [unclassified Rathayibacter]KQQ00097.1 hypothetical protein ASF42_17120 [Rathayibacter sp. Leaf294]KQS09551.1 hypothetical protein ASG06_17120 [Rathayibacter sp. Leaf185]